MSEFFKFERIKEDIPFYNGTPELSLVDWIALIAGFVISFLIYRGAIPLEPIPGLVVGFLASVLPVLWVFRGNYSLIFKKITRADIKPMVILTVVGFIYSLVAVGICGVLGIIPMEKNIGLAVFTFSTEAVILIVHLFAEELFKLAILLISMFVVYKFAKNRKVSLIISMIITAVLFAACHEGSSGPMLQVLIVQGVSTIFDLILYLNTKNIVATYISHVVFDLAVTALKVFGTAGALSS